MPADVCQVGWFGDEAGGDALPFLRITQTLQHRIHAVRLRPCRDVIPQSGDAPRIGIAVARDPESASPCIVDQTKESVRFRR